MVCFDTDFLIAFMQDSDPAAKRKLEELRIRGLTFANTTVISVFELYKGAFSSKKKDGALGELARVERLLAMFDILPLDQDSAKMTGEFHSKLKTNPIGEADLLIAGIAASKGEVLITRNIKHFERVPGLKVERW